MKVQYVNIPTFLETGESAAAKTATTGKMVSIQYEKGMELLTGDGMTTSCETEIIIDPNLQKAHIIVERITNDEICVKILKNLHRILFFRVKSLVASLPDGDDKAFEQFVADTVKKGSKMQDEKFKVHKLLINKCDDYHSCLYVIFKTVFMEAVGKTFKDHYNDVKKKSEKEANKLIDQLILDKLDCGDCKNSINDLVNLIESEIAEIFNEGIFERDEDDSACFVCNNLDSERFANTIKVISNSERKELEKVPSIACVLKSVHLIMPGYGIKVDSNTNSAYRLIDIIGFTNDGLDNVDTLVENAMLSQYNYDGILYFASKKTIRKTHESFLEKIFKSMRPAKLIIVSTLMDKDDIFDEDEVPTMDMIQELNKKRIHELLDIVERVATSDMHIILPSEEDIICVSNKVNERKHGEAACRVYSTEQYDFIRKAIERAVNITRKKICVNVSRTSQYLISTRQPGKIVGQLIKQIGESIDEEYSELCDDSDWIHHWTLNAILWNLSYGCEHKSKAAVWRNVRIATFSRMQKICLDNLGDFTFISDVKIEKQEDVCRIKNEFRANLYTALYGGVRCIILKDSNNSNQPSSCKQTIQELALKSKSNKWKILDDLRLCLLKEIAQTDYWERILDESIRKALLVTYDKMLY